MRNDVRKLGADTQEIAEDVLDQHAAFDGRPSLIGRAIIWPVVAALYVLAFGFAWLALSAAIYALWRLVRWTLGWF